MAKKCWKNAIYLNIVEEPKTHEKIMEIIIGGWIHRLKYILDLL